MDNFLIYSAVAAATVVSIYYFLISKSDSLTARGIPNEKPLPIIGNGLDILLQRTTVIDFFEKMYFRFANEKLFGFTNFLGKYIVVVKDAALIKQITVKDFDHFVNRDPFEHAEADKYLSKSLILLRDQKWRDMRATISPVFTSSKLRNMFNLLADTIEDFVSLYEDKAKKNNGNIVIDTHDAFARVTADGIATTTLGFTGDCVRNENSKIYEVACALEDDFTNQNNFILQHLPTLYKLFGLQICRKSVHDFFENNVLSEMKRRQTEKITRPDVIQLLIQAKEGKLKIEKGEESELSYLEAKVKKISQWSDEDLVSQAVVMFLGGFETTAILMQAISFELASDAEVQQTLIDEIDEVLKTLNGEKISYEQLNEMKFMEMIVSEALRKWPSFRITSRECTKECTLVDEESGNSYVIAQGTELLLPIGAIQNDPRYFADPEKFDPYRFSDDNKTNIESGSFIPFGYGPRMCIGSRYAILDAKMLLFYILSKFSINKCDETPRKMELATGLTGFRNKIAVNLKMRNWDLK